MEELVYLINCPPCWIKTPPLGIEYIKQYLIKEGIDVRVIDLNIIIYKLLGLAKDKWLSLDRDYEEKLLSIVKSRYPNVIQKLIKNIEKSNLIGFSLYERNKKFALNLAQILQKKYPKKKIVFGGPQTLFMRIHKENFLKPFKWVIGEGEKALVNIIKGNKKDIIEHEELKDLDELPFMDFKGFDLKLYSQFLPLVSSRGCIKMCRFCTENLLYKSFRQHSFPYMLEQIELLVKKHNMNNFTFQDSLINANLDWLENFCSSLIKKNIKINWEAQAIIRNDFSQTLADLLKKSGCFNLFVGLESGSDKILRLMNKGFTKDDALKFFNTLKKSGLHFEVSLIFGYPHEEEEDFAETVIFIVKNKKIITKIAQVNPFVDYFLKNQRNRKEILNRVNKFINIVKKEKIPYTKGFINNLIDRKWKLK